MNDMRFATLRKAMVEQPDQPNKVIDEQVIAIFNSSARAVCEPQMQDMVLY